MSTKYPKKMYPFCQKNWKSKYNVRFIKNLIIGKIKSFTINKIELVDDKPCIADVYISVLHRGKNKKLVIRMIKEITPYKTSEEGEWGIVEIENTARIKKSGVVWIRTGSTRMRRSCSMKRGGIKRWRRMKKGNRPWKG